MWVNFDLLLPIAVIERIIHKYICFDSAGSNGMGQAQSQSSGSGCDECYGNEGSYSHGKFYLLWWTNYSNLKQKTILGDAGGPDPLRSSAGSSTGLPQSQTSSNTPLGYDAYGRQILPPIAGSHHPGGQGNKIYLQN